MDESSTIEKPKKTKHFEMIAFIHEYVMEHGSYNQPEILTAYNKMRKGKNEKVGSKSTVSRLMNKIASENGKDYETYFNGLIEEGKRNNKHKFVDKGLVGFTPDVKLTLIQTKDFMAEQVAEGIQRNHPESISFHFTNRSFVLVASKDDATKKVLCDYLDERLHKRNQDD